MNLFAVRFPRKRIERFFICASAALYLAACMPPPGPQGAPGPMSPKTFIFSTVYFILMVILVYFVMVIQPAQKKQDAHDKFVQGLKKNDEVLAGGIFARVVQVKPEYVALEIAPGIKIKVEPRSVQPVKKVDSSGSSDQDKTPAGKK